MRILLFANNRVGWQIAAWVKERGDDIVGLVLHPPHRRKYGHEIARSVGVSVECIFDGAQLRQPETLDAIRQLNADIGLSVLFGYILHSDLVRIFPAGVVNLHPAYLPYNKGAFPNVWSIVEGTPAGVSLHYIDAGVDTGDIIAQRPVPVTPTDTGKTLYHKLELACIELFRQTWPLILRGQAQRSPQLPGAGTRHSVRDVEGIDEIDLERAYTARELINILRARTFPPHPGAYFRDGGRKVYLRLQLLSEDELSEAAR